jgi:sulfite reductase (NADPH) flavoprotein alpha-component
MKLEGANSLLTLPTPLREVPVLPESAPFTAEQRAWLNGFLAGLYSRAPLTTPSPAGDSAPSQALQPLTILFGSQTGNAETLARRAAKAAGQRGFAPTVCDLAQYDRGGLTQEQNLLLITSTYGEGEPPDNARPFWKYLSGESALPLPELRYSVCALGDSNYEKFCQCGKDFDRRLAELQAKRVAPRVDCDVDFDEGFRRWLDGVWAGFSDAGTTSATMRQPSGPAVDRPAAETVSESTDAPAWSRNRPFPARLCTNRLLNSPGSAKETRHLEIALDGSGLDYEPGDALGVMPTNCPELVEEMIQVLHAQPETPVPGKQRELIPLRQALVEVCDITRISKPLLAFFAERTGDALLKQLTAPDVNGELEKFLWGREVIDLLLAHPDVRPAPAEFVGLLKKLQPRCYSISSSPKAHPGEVHLTVGIVRYESLGRARKGVCSCFLSDRVQQGTPVPVFVQTNKGFRLPVDGARPVIMVGPGTGIAPFRAFLEERKATGAGGKNWLFFGDQRESSDFLYREELTALLNAGQLTHLHTAFSRDQERKTYVQHRMQENAKELFAWLEDGAHFYVCGDANRMARDVDAALHQAIEQASGRTPEQVADYVENLRTQRRYQRDVY